MTAAEDQLASRQRNRLKPWARKAVKLVSDKIADTRAHAEKAVTETLKATPDGRPSLALIKRNPSFKAALNRLDELYDTIAGPAVTSINGLVHDATESFYLNARDYWFHETPDAFRVQTPAPSDAQLKYVRGLLWFGMPLRQDFAPQFQRLQNTLSTAVGAAGSDLAVTSAPRQIAALRTWESQSRTTMMQRLGLALNDANQRADLQAMRDTIRPEFQSQP